MEQVHTYKPLQAKMSSNKSAAKTITVNDKLEGKEADYVPIGLEYLHKHPSAALTAVVNLLNCHMADMFIMMLAVVGDKYGHTIDDMIETVKADPRWESVQAHPLVKSLSYFDQRDADETIARSIGQKAISDMPVQQLQEETSTTTIKKMRLKKAAPAPAPAPAEEVAVATVPAEEAAVVTPAKPAKKAAKKAAPTAAEPTEVITTTVTHEELESYGGGAEEAPSKPVKKAVKKVAAAAAAEEVAEAPPKPAKKAAKKAVAASVEVDTTAEITEQMKTMAVSAAPAPTKKTVPKKTATK